MKNMSEEELNKINEILRTCREAEKGYATAHEQVQDSNLKYLFDTYRRQRKDFVYDLEQHIRTMGEDPSKGTSVAAGAHRAWINVKGTVTGHDPKAILQECIRGEKEALEVYQNALARLTFPNDTRLLLLHQSKKVKDACENMQERLDAYRSA